MYPYIRSSVFVSQNIFDSNQLVAQLGLTGTHSKNEQAYMKYFGAAMYNSLDLVCVVTLTRAVKAGLSVSPSFEQVIQKALTSGGGIFASSCFAHTDNIGFDGRTVVNGTSDGKAIGDWFFKRTSRPLFVDAPCSSGLPCNPSCPHKV